MASPMRASAAHPSADDTNEETTQNDPEITSSALSRLDRIFLLRPAKFLVAIQQPVYATRAHLHGYDDAAHREGWGNDSATPSPICATGSTTGARRSARSSACANRSPSA